MPAAPQSSAIARPVVLAAGLALAIAPPPAHAQEVVHWASAVDGDFGVAPNWFPPVVPGTLDTAVLGGVGPYVVSINTTRTVGFFDLANPDATLLVQPSQVLTLNGLAGDGVLTIHDASTTNNATVEILDGGVLDGRILLNGLTASDAFLRGSAGSIVLGTGGAVGGQGTILGSVTGGTLRHDAGVLNIRNVAISDSIIEPAGGEFDTNGGTLIANSTIRGVYRIEPSDTITFGSGVAIEDEIVVNNALSTNNATLLVQEGATLVGRIRLDGLTASDAFLRGATGLLLLDASTVVTGQGTLMGMVSGGTIRDSGDMLTLRDARLTGAIIEADDGEFDTNGGTVFSDSTVRGPYRIEPSDTLTLGPGVVIEDELVVNNALTTNNATLLVQESATLTGRIRLNGFTANDAFLRSVTGSFLLGDTSEIHGTGTLGGAVSAGGLLSPGYGPDGIGLLSTSSVDIDMTPTARIAIDAGGTADDEFDRIAGTGTITLDGALDVNFVDGYIPEPRDRFEIIRATAIDGAFADITIEPVGTVGPAHIVSKGDSVVVVICAADRDADGELTIFDFLAFQNLFGAGDLRADLDEDGMLTIFDFLVYQNRFDAGCG